MWDIQDGVLGADEDITRSVYLDGEFTALIWEAIDSLGRKKGDEIDLSTFQVIEKTLTFPGADFLPTDTTVEVSRPFGVYLEPGTAATDTEITRSAILPVGVTLTEIESTAKRSTSSDKAVIRLFVDDINLTTLGELTHSASGSETTETATLNRQTDGERYVMLAELRGDSAAPDARLTEVKLTYRSPSYAQTY